MTTELLERLNEAIDTRGDRISIFRQRLYESLRIVAIVTSAIWLIPFYFLSFDVGIFGSLLKLGVTVLIILVLSIIDDLDQPFEGFWRINTSTWEEVLNETKEELYELVKKADRKYILRMIRSGEQVLNSLSKNDNSHPVSKPLLLRGLSLFYLLIFLTKRYRK